MIHPLVIVTIFFYMTASMAWRLKIKEEINDFCALTYRYKPSAFGLVPYKLALKFLYSVTIKELMSRLIYLKLSCVVGSCVNTSCIQVTISDCISALLHSQYFPFWQFPEQCSESLFCLLSELFLALICSNLIFLKSIFTTLGWS